MACGAHGVGSCGTSDGGVEHRRTMMWTARWMAVRRRQLLSAYCTDVLGAIAQLIRGLDTVATPEAFLAKAFLTLGRRDGVL